MFSLKDVVEVFLDSEVGLVLTLKNNNPQFEMLTKLSAFKLCNISYCCEIIILLKNFNKVIDSAHCLLKNRMSNTFSLTDVQQQELDRIYRAEGYICKSCDKPYTWPYIYPSSQEIRCKQCWPDPTHSKYWYHAPIHDKMQQMELVFSYLHNAVADGEENLDIQNELALEAIHDGNWKDALDNFERNKHRRDNYQLWKNMSQYILVDACENPECPKEIIDYLVTKSGPRIFNTRPCINPGGIGAMTSLCVAAEKGNVSAIKVFIETAALACMGYHWPAVCAFSNNKGECFDLLIAEYLRRDYNYKVLETSKNQTDYPPRTFEHDARVFSSDFAVSRMIETAVEENLDQSLRVIKKYQPDREHSDFFNKVLPWP